MCLYLFLQQLPTVAHNSGVRGGGPDKVLSQVGLVQASTPPPQVHPGPGVLMEAGLAPHEAQVLGTLSGPGCKWGSWT